MQDATKIKDSLKTQLYSLIVFVKTSKEYSEFMLTDPSVKQEARGALKFMSNSCTSFINRIRGGISTEDGKRTFDAEWQKDYLAWASIFDSLVRMDEMQIEGVEQFCLGILKGDVVITKGQRCPACYGDNVEAIGGNNRRCCDCKHHYVEGAVEEL